MKHLSMPNMPRDFLVAGPGLALSVLLAACMAAPGVPAGAQSPLAPVDYTCSDGSALRVRFEAEAAVVTLPDGTELRLPQQRAASGMWYATPQHELRGKGDEATWTVGRRAPASCTVRR